MAGTAMQTPSMAGGPAQPLLSPVRAQGLRPIRERRAGAWWHRELQQGADFTPDTQGGRNNDIEIVPYSDSEGGVPGNNTAGEDDNFVHDSSPVDADADSAPVDPDADTEEEVNFRQINSKDENDGSDFEAEGDVTYCRGDYALALTLYTIAVQNNPNDSTLYAKRSLCSLHMGDKGKALDDANTYKICSQIFQNLAMNRELLSDAGEGV